MARQVGPTVYEAATVRLRKLRREMERLRKETEDCTRRMMSYAGSSMLESERLATRAEVFLPQQLPGQS